jgi:hypothetical protein
VTDTITYGLWTVLGPDPRDPKALLVRCQCQTVESRDKGKLRRGETRSCRRCAKERSQCNGFGRTLCRGRRVET